MHSFAIQHEGTSHQTSFMTQACIHVTTSQSRNLVNEHNVDTRQHLKFCMQTSWKGQRRPSSIVERWTRYGIGRQRVRHSRSTFEPSDGCGGRAGRPRGIRATPRLTRRHHQRGLRHLGSASQGGSSRRSRFGPADIRLMAQSTSGKCRRGRSSGIRYSTETTTK